MPQQPSSPEDESAIDPEVQARTPRVGLILGPGGMKSMAHIGVLREFEKYKIPIHAIAGMEWGALIAAAYSVKGKVNDTEWQISKLKKNNLPGRGFLSSSVEPASVKTLTNYLDTVFANKTIETAQIPFACPSILLANGKIAWWDRGSYSQILEKCMPFPPIYEPNSSWVAAAFQIEEAARYLREKGANIIVFVNVLARGQVLKGSSVRDAATMQILWWEGVHHLQGAVKSVDWNIGVNTRNYDILDFDARQSFVIFGQESGAAAAKKIADTYGF